MGFTGWLVTTFSLHPVYPANAVRALIGFSRSRAEDISTIFRLWTFWGSGMRIRKSLRSFDARQGGCLAAAGGGRIPWGGLRTGD